MKSKNHEKILELEENYKRYLEEKEFKKAEKTIRLLRECCPDKAEYAYMYADLLILLPTKDLNERKRNLNRAEIILIKKINNRSDKNGDISLKLAEVYLEQRNYEKVIDVVESNFFKYKKDKKRALAYYFLGLAYDMNKDQKNAIINYKRSIEIREMSGCYTRLMQLLYGNKEYKESRKCFRSALKNSENPSRLYLEDAKFLSKMLKIEEAKLEYSLALANNYQDPKLLEIEKHIRGGRKTEAKQILKSMLEGENKDFATLLLALLYIEEKQNYEAKQLLSKLEIKEITTFVLTEIMIMANIIKDKYLYEIILMYNEDSIEENKVIKFSHIKMLRHDGKYQDAFEAIESLPDDEKNNPYIRFEKAKILQEMMETEEAEKIFMSLLNTGLSKQALTSLCDLYIYVGEVKKAKILIESVERDFILETKKIEILIYEDKISEAKKRIKENITEEKEENFYEAKMMIALKEENYKTAKYYFDLYKERELIFKNKSKRKLEDLEFLINYKLGFTMVPKTYFQRQLIEYNKQDAIEHISHHMKENEYKMQHTIFDQEQNPKDIYTSTKERLNKKSLHVTDRATDIYIIDLKKIIATKNHIPTSFVRVITIVNTDKILTIHPIWPLQTDLITYKQKTEKQRVRK